MNYYDMGDLIRLSLVFTNAAGAATDPTTVSLKVRTPDGVESTYTYANGDITKDSTGNYHYDLSATKAGVHTCYATGTGTVQAGSSVLTFTVRANPF